MKHNNNSLFIFGAGVGIGLLSLWAIIELAPIIAFGGVGYLMIKSLTLESEEEQ